MSQETRERVESGAVSPDEVVKGFLDRTDWYARTIDTAVATLQGRDHGAVSRASRREYFPPSLDARAEWLLSTYVSVENYRALLGGLSDAQRAKIASASRPLRFAFGTSSETDEACFRASTVLADVARVIRRAIDPDFAIDAYSEKLSAGAATFAPLRSRLSTTAGNIDRWIDEIASELIRIFAPDVVGFTVPFPGTLYGALRMAAVMKAQSPRVRTLLGGGLVNTTLRDLSDPGIFDYIDFITLDDGERPLQCLLEHLEGRRPANQLVRTFHREAERVIYSHSPAERDVPFAKTGTPTYRGLPLDQYLRYRPSLQSFKGARGRRWNKLTLAHGCYWKKCVFCDTSLDYIARYEPATVDFTIDRIKRLQDETRESGFHFVDEAMPPGLMRRLAERLIEEKMSIAWRGNVRFDEALVPIAPLLAESGCSVLSGGLEVASDRLLALMEKGVSLEQAARVCHALSSVDIFTHAYLMYGFPTQTVQETIDALEFVRQMFEAGALGSAYWHEFSLTEFSPVASQPQRFGIAVRPHPKQPFSNYNLEYDEPGAAPHSHFGEGLEGAVQAYALGIGFDRPVEAWFDQALPATTLPRRYVRSLLDKATAPR